MPQLMRTVERRKLFARAARRGFADREASFASGRAPVLQLDAEEVHALRADAEQLRRARRNEQRVGDG